MKFNRFIITALLALLIITNCFLLLQIKSIEKQIKEVDNSLQNIYGGLGGIESRIYELD